MTALHSPAPPQDGKAPREHRAKRLLGRAAVAFAALLLLLVAFALFAVFTESGARIAWNAAQRILGGQLSGEVAGGTLADGLQLRNVVYEDATKRLQIDRLDGKWQLSRSPLMLTVQNLQIGKADLTLRPGPEKEPAGLPKEIKLPLAFDLQRAGVQELAIHSDGSTNRINDIVLRAGSDRVHHRVELERAVTPFGKAAASMRLNGQDPFALSGNANLDGGLREIPYRLGVELSGTLREPGIRLDAAAAGATARADVAATPFAEVPLRRAEMRVRSLNPKALNPNWPEARLDITADLAPAAGAGTARAGAPLTVAGPVTLNNAEPGAIDRGRLPLASARAEVVMDAARQQLSQLTVTLADDAKITGSAELRGADQGELALQASGIDLQALHSKLRETDLTGPFSVTLRGQTQQIHLDLSDRTFSVVADATLDPRQVSMQTARVKAGVAGLELSGTMARDAESAFDVKGTLTDFNPALFFAPSPKGRSGKGKSAWRPADARIGMDFQAQGKLQPGLRAQATFDIDNRSSYAGLPMTGGGNVSIDGKRLLPSDARLSIAGNRAAIKGSFGAPSDRLDVRIDAPALDRLGFGLSGRLRVDGRVAGSFEHPAVDATYSGENLGFGDWRATHLSGQAQVQGMPGSTPDAKLRLELAGRGLEGGGASLASMSAGVNGSYANHAVTLEAKGRVYGRALDARLNARGRLRELPDGLGWDGTLDGLENRGFPRLSLAQPLELAVAPGKIALGAARLTLEQTSVELKGFNYDAAGIRSSGAFRALDVARLLELRQQMTGAAPPFRTDLVLDGDWDITLAELASGFATVKRRSGDISLPQDKGRNRLGLSDLSARADFQGRQVALTAGFVTSRVGTMNADALVTLQQSDGRASISPDSMVSGRIAGGIPRLQSLGFLLGPSIVLDGSAAVNLTIAGTVADPRISGTAAGNQLAVTLYDQGVRLHDGVASLVLNDNVVELQQLEFHAGGGTLRATGRLPLAQTRENMRAVIMAEKLQLLSNPSGQMTLSGRAEANAVDGQLLVTGDFVVDHALFSLPEKSAPRLGDDVVVVRRGQNGNAPAADANVMVVKKQPAGPFSPRINIRVDLGNDFRFEGSGADLRLAGALNIRAAPGEAPQAFGTVRVAEGTYEAFGAELEIERGVINFQGAFQNPNLNIVAMRREQEVAAGVNVTGTAQRPRVQLVSEPNVPDEEKLSWLVFGRAGTGGNGAAGQAQAAARGAALGLLNKFGGERIARGFGLDEFSFGESEFGLDGQQVVNLGKEISERLYLGYEQSLANAEAVLKLTYELTRNWSVVLRGGAVTGLDVYFGKRFDRIRPEP
ncbi:MAG TPA: translocation/assembly module TamB domain-containing protein, partial [Noviherbaspirillum sp.]|uniref:translocation/assembly module TamB domain-containing protein n=1 Tax=Noviherbaspirillum sp. TaxID=1926288 RepID=UPI002D4B65D5